MPTALIKKIHETVNIPISDMEALWDRAKKAAQRYDEGTDHFYAVSMRIFQNMMGSHYPKQWKKYIKLRSESSASMTLTIKLQGDCAGKFANLLSLIETVTSEGSGVTLSYETNSGDKGKMYFDGDGVDRLTLDRAD